MRADVHLLTLAVVVVLTSCATSPPSSCPPAPRGVTQPLLLRTDPAGASCAVSRDGIVVASVDATPGIADVPRRKEAIQVVCRKEGYLEQRLTFVAVSAHEVEAQGDLSQECPKREPSAVDVAGGSSSILVRGPSPHSFRRSALGLGWSRLQQRR